MAVVLCMVIATGRLAVFYLYGQESDEEAASSGSLQLLDDTFTERMVTDEASAILAAQDAAEVLELENAMEELEPSDTTAVSGDTYYRLQQYYQGIPVFGRTVVITADENGEVLTLSGNVADIDADISLMADVTQEDLEESFAVYAEDELGISGDVSLEDISDDALVIYDLYSEGEACLAYELSAWTEEGSYVVLLDANSAEVLLAYETLSDVTITGTNSSGTVTVNASASEEGEDTYVLCDEERGIYIFDLDGISSHVSIGRKVNDEGNLEVFKVDVRNGNLVTTTDLDSNGNAVFVDDAVNYLNTLSMIYDAYEQLGIECIYTIYANYNDGYDNGKNASGGAGTASKIANGNNIGYISTGSVTGVSDFDALAHEFAHYIMQSHVKPTSEYGGSISEGFADIYGCLIECEIEEWDEPDWSITGDNIGVYRDMANPSDSGNIAYWSGEDTSENPYGYSTVISHAAYLMWRGKDSAIGIGQTYGELSVDELAELWYRAMLMFPSDCDFYQVCQLVELAAEHMSLSDDQKECISWAFYQVGIAEIYTLDTDFDLTLYDTNGNKYADYYASVEVVLSYKASSADAAVIYEPNVDGVLSFHLDNGKGYQITLVDNQDDTKKFVFYVYISKGKGDNTLSCYTDFGRINTNGTYSGTVVDASDASTPVVGAVVTISDEGGTIVAELTTDETGNFVGQCDQGSYTFTVEADGYKTATLSREVESGKTMSETILLALVGEFESIDAEDIAKAMNEAGLFAWNWFYDNQYTDKENTIEADYGSDNVLWLFECITEEGITSLDDVDVLAQHYFSTEVADELISNKEWIEANNALYVSATEDLGDMLIDYCEMYVQQLNDFEYNIELYTYYVDGSSDQEEFLYSYINGFWVFDTTLAWNDEVPITVIEAEYYNTVADNEEDAENYVWRLTAILEKDGADHITLFEYDDYGNLTSFVYGVEYPRTLDFACDETGTTYTISNPGDPDYHEEIDLSTRDIDYYIENGVTYQGTLADMYTLYLDVEYTLSIDEDAQSVTLECVYQNDSLYKTLVYYYDSDYNIIAFDDTENIGDFLIAENKTLEYSGDKSTVTVYGEWSDTVILEPYDGDVSSATLEPVVYTITYDENGNAESATGGDSTYTFRWEKYLSESDDTNVEEPPEAVSNTDSAALVTDAAFGTFEGLYEDAYEWHIPQINLTGSEIEAINDEVWTLCNDYVEWNYEQIEEGDGNQVLLDYSWYVNSDVLSLLIDVIYLGDLQEYYIYNTEISTGEIITDDELLNYFDLTQESYEELVEQVRDDFYASFSLGSEVEPYSTNLFINDDGELCLAETTDLGGFVINLGVFID